MSNNCISRKTEQFHITHNEAILAPRNNDYFLSLFSFRFGNPILGINEITPWYQLLVIRK